MGDALLVADEFCSIPWANGAEIMSSRMQPEGEPYAIDGQTVEAS